MVEKCVDRAVILVPKMVVGLKHLGGEPLHRLGREICAAFQKVVNMIDGASCHSHGLHHWTDGKNGSIYSHFTVEGHGKIWRT